MLTVEFAPVLAGLYHDLLPDSREFEDLLKIVSSCYLDSSSRGAFSYCKARLIHNELLEKEVSGGFHPAPELLLKAGAVETFLRRRLLPFSSSRSGER